MLNTSGVQNIWFYLLRCSNQGEFVALRGITLQAPQNVAPTALLQQIQIERLHAEGKQLAVGTHGFVYFVFYSKLYFVSGNEKYCPILSAPRICSNFHSMQFLRKPFHALCMCRDYCFRGRMIGIPTLHSGKWTWELRTPDRLQTCSPRSPLCLAFMTWKTDLRLQWMKKKKHEKKWKLLFLQLKLWKSLPSFHLLTRRTTEVTKTGEKYACEHTFPSPPLPFQRTASMNKEGQRSRKVSSSSLK